MTTRRIGYARVSKNEQNLDLQLELLNAAGVIAIYQEKISSRKQTRPELEAALKACGPGDSLVVWRLDRVGRSLIELTSTVRMIQDRGVELISLRENIDTTTATGRFAFHMFASMAEWERDVIRERTLDGLAAARAQGRVGGRPRKITGAQLEHARQLRDAGRSYPQIGRLLNVNRETVRRAILEPAAGGKS